MIGAVLHTVNIRLFPEQVCWVFGHADDKIAFVDASLATAVANAMATRPDMKMPFVVMGASDVLPGAHDYEANCLPGKPGDVRLAGASTRSRRRSSAIRPPRRAIRRACFSRIARPCCTHSRPDFPRRSRSARSDTVLPVVPMFHVNAWGVPYLVPMVGANLVMPGPKLDPKSVIDLVNEEKVTMSLGVPTVWLAVRDMLDATDTYLPSLKTLVIGGSACPPSLFDDLEKRHIRVIHAWGMTEMSPIGTTSRVVATTHKARHGKRSARSCCSRRGASRRSSRGSCSTTNGKDVPRDGEVRRATCGCAASPSRPHIFAWGSDLPDLRRTGIFIRATSVPSTSIGYLQIVDRSKDLVKSGGEWISSVDLENTFMGHPAVREAAVIGLPHAEVGRAAGGGRRTSAKARRSTKPA